MKNILVVIDMQNDFIDGALVSEKASAIVDSVAEKITRHNGMIFATLDTHFEDYLSTAEGKRLPVVHCVKGTHGWQLNGKIAAALQGKDCITVEKHTFGSLELAEEIKAACGDENPRIELVGLCTDICVISNALILKASFPESNIVVDSKCCAGISEKLHNDALLTMESCQIDIIR